MYNKKTTKWSWEDFEIEYLKENYNKRSNQLIAIQLDRKPAAIAMKLKRLGLSRENEDNIGQFKKGNKLRPNFPIDTISTMNFKGKPTQMIKTVDGWKNYNVYSIEQSMGKIPKGYCIKYIDGNENNTDLSNIKIVPKKNINKL